MRLHHTHSCFIIVAMVTLIQVLCKFIIKDIKKSEKKLVDLDQLSFMVIIIRALIIVSTLIQI